MPSTTKSLSRSAKVSNEKRSNLLQSVLPARLIRRSQHMLLLLPLSLLAAAICIGTAVYSENVLLGELGKAFSILVLLNLLRLLKGPKHKNNI